MKLETIIKKIEEAMNATREETGSFKYDFIYEECIDIIKKQNENT